MVGQGSSLRLAHRRQRAIAHRLRLAVPNDAPHAGGLCIYGAETGELPLDPTFDIHTRDPLPEGVGGNPDSPVARPAGP